MFLAEIYSIPLVILSIAIAVIASFTTSGILERSASANDNRRKIGWIMFGALSMGSGIWAMHFIGMLALMLPIPVYYDLAITIISIIPAFFASALILRFMSLANYDRKYLLVHGLLLGVGIGLMHHTGLAAMRMDAVMVHDKTLLFLSVLFAIVAASFALKIQSETANSRFFDNQLFTKRKSIGALVMGVAISGMHYSAMLGVNFSAEKHNNSTQGVSSDGLAVIISIVVIIIILVSIFIPLFLRYKQTVKELKFSARVFSNTHEGIMITESDGRIIEVNPAFSAITGYPSEEVMGLTPRIFRSGKHEQAFYEDMWQSLVEQGHWHGEVWNRNKRGEVFAELLDISALKDANGNTINYVAIFSDITRSKEQQTELELMAHYDALTQLPNRALFYDRFLQAVARSKRSSSLLAVCFLDLDDFKRVNDTRGHHIGDQLLVAVAERIKSNLREEDTISRQGGDEFTLLLGDIEHVHQADSLLSRIVEVLAEPYEIDGQTIDISVSLGATLYPADDGDIDTLIRHADKAMYQAKLAGKNRCQIFSLDDAHRAMRKHHQLEEIKQALINKEFKLYYQPKVNMETGQVYGAEALIRWIHPEKGLIPPLDFLPLIERTDLEVQVGGWVINEALAQITRWQQQGLTLEVSVNIASHHLQSVGFFKQLSAALDRNPEVKPHSLQLEILESSALGDLVTISGIIKRCQDSLGVSVALDDFGTGYSSLTHLRSLSADVIKIDQTFVRDMLDEKGDLALIEGIIGLAKAFDCQVIAEGVETADHGMLLIRIGCLYAQGYGIARPMPADEVLAWVGEYEAAEPWPCSK
ncbi:MAG: EAL domain-containing protein [Cycloclasticus sp.]